MEHCTPLLVEGQHFGSVDKLLQPIHKCEHQPLSVLGDMEGESALVASHTHTAVPHIHVAKAHGFPIVSSADTAPHDTPGLCTALAAALHGHLGGQRVPTALDLPLLCFGDATAVLHSVPAPDPIILLPCTGLHRATTYVIVEGVGGILEAIVGQPDKEALRDWVARGLIRGCGGKWCGYNVSSHSTQRAPQPDPSTVLYVFKVLDSHDPDCHRTPLKEMEQLLLIPIYTWGNRVDC